MSALAQQGGYSLFRSFTVADGLPSNHIYTCVEDNKGFLWVATDAGIARFDGKNFQVFTTQQGLPDDDVLNVVKEKNGRIWVNCFKQSPAYFDEIKNRFINAKEDTNLAKVNGTGVIYLTALPEGGVMYNNEKGSFVFENNKLIHFVFATTASFSSLVIKRYDSESYLACAYHAGGLNHLLVYINKDKVVDSLSIENYINRRLVYTFIDDNKFYIFNNNGDCYILSAFQTAPLRYKVDSISIKEPKYWQGFTPSYINIISSQKNIHVFDKKTLQKLYIFSGNYIPNSLYNGIKENIWIASIDKGLMLYKKKSIEILPVPDNFYNTHFLSIARKPSGIIFAGNFNGQVIETDGKYFTVHQLPLGSGTNWQRKIIISNNKIFTFSEGGGYSNFSNQLLRPGGMLFSSKAAEVLNDSIIIEGSYGQLISINTITKKTNILYGLKKRTTCIGVAPGNFIYHGSTDGLYKYDYNKSHDSDLTSNHPLLSERVTAISCTPDGVVWVGTASKGLLALRNDSVINIFSTANGIISNSIKCLSGGRPGEIWAGTNSGVSIIRYTNGAMNFTSQNLSVNDGLSSNIINEMLYSNDTVYCATGNGISTIPANINLPKFDIPVQLTGVVINNSDTVLSPSYHLRYNQNNIQLHFAGIELGGHFAYFQYRIGKNNWQSIEGNTLNLQLNSGNHKLEVRAVDVNGNVGTKPLQIEFIINTPFWKALWFWIIITLLAGGLLIWLIRRRDLAKRETTLQTMLNHKKLTELELQALKSQINPHFIFNCLNSIKFLNHQKKYNEAEKYLDRFAALLRSALEQSSLQQITLQQEIDFIENYLALEKLRLPDKLSYNIEIAAGINAANTLIPSMLLQPYIENAVKHGVAPLKNRQGQIDIRFYLNKNYLMAEVQDNGNGIAAIETDTSGTGIGNKNTGRRSSLYNIECSITNLQTKDVNLSGTLVQLTIPLQQN